MPLYGPGRPQFPESYTEYPTPDYLHKYANKIKYDLNKYFRLYTGKRCVVYKNVVLGERCPECTDLLTGAKVLSECSVCGGTGYKNKYDLLGVYYALVEYSNDTRINAYDGQKELNPVKIIITCEHELDDGDLIAFFHTKHVFKIIQQGSDLGAVQGEIVTQSLVAELLEPNSIEYTIIDWRL